MAVDLEQPNRVEQDVSIAFPPVVEPLACGLHNSTKQEPLAVALRQEGVNARETHQKQVEEDLRENRAILQNIYDSSPCLMGVAELNGEEVLAIHINNAAARFFATKSPAAIHFDHTRLSDAEEVNHLWVIQCQHCLGENMPVSFEYEHPTSKGKRWLSVVLASLDTRNRHHPRFSFVAEDITHRKRAEEDLQRSKSRLSDILESISDGFLSVSYQWEIIYVNQRAAINSGLDRQELLSRNIWEAFPELINTQHEVNYRKAMAQRTARHFEMGGTAPDSWYDISVYPSPEGISIYWIDISERKHAERALQQANNQLERRVAERTLELARLVKTLQEEVDERKKTEQKLLHLNRLYAVLSETNQAIVHASHRDSLFEEVCRVAIQHGYFTMAWIGLCAGSPGEVSPASWSGFDDGYLDLVRAGAREAALELPATSAAIRDGVLWICNDIATESSPPWREESERRGYRSAAAIPLKRNGKMIGVFTIYAGEAHYFGRQLINLLQQMAVDISFALDTLDLAARRREAEQKLQKETDDRLKALEKVHEQDRLLMEQSRHAAMGEMIGNIAHQWRQPLNSLALMVQRLPLYYEAGKFHQDFLEHSVEKAMELIRHMSQTIDDFSSFFRPEKNKISFRLADVVAKTLSLVEASFKDQGITLAIKSTADPVVIGHPNEFSQILLNILVNARDAFMERPQTTQPHIIIKMGTNAGKALVTITDNAGGIAEQLLPKIFDPYFTTKGPDKGTGIGLHMAKTIIEKNMKGLLTVRNTRSGAEFRIEV